MQTIKVRPRPSTVCGKTGAGVTILAYMRRQIALLRQRRQFGTAENYECALVSLSAFLNGRDLPFSRMNEELVLKYGDWLRARNIVRNSISFYMRIWRAVYNRAAGEGITAQACPFRKVYTGVDRTRKRAVDERAILKLLEPDLTAFPSVSLARDLFLFSYCTRGMAFVDIAFLRKCDIRDGSLVYCRRKTGRLLRVRIEPCIACLIDRYKEKTGNSEYVFPILRSTEAQKAYVQYRTALGHYNRQLKRLSRLAGLDLALSFHTARHSWATAARDHAVPLPVISAALGHASEKTTEIYLASIENSVIDEANRSLLSEINRVISL